MIEFTTDNLFALIGIIAFLIVVYVVRKDKDSSNDNTPEKKVVGSPEFVARVSGAIRLLRTNSSYYAFYDERILSIVEVDRHTGVHASNKPAKFDLSTKYAMGASLTWLASVLVHEAQHVEIKHNSAFASVGDIQAELICNAEQIKCLQQIGGTAFEIDYLTKADGTHFDTNGNGVLDGGDDWNYTVKR